MSAFRYHDVENGIRQQVARQKDLIKRAADEGLAVTPLALFDSLRGLAAMKQDKGVKQGGLPAECFQLLS